MIRFFLIDDGGQSTPIVAVSFLLVFCILAGALSLAWLGTRRSDLQAAADAAALAGADSLAKAQMTVALFELTQFSVHLAGDLLILGGSIAAALTGAAAGGLMNLGFQVKEFAETKLDPALDKAKDMVHMIGPVYAVANSMAYASANHGCAGVGIPWPMEGLGQLIPDERVKAGLDYTERMKDLLKKLEQCAEKIREAELDQKAVKEGFVSGTYVPIKDVHPEVPDGRLTYEDVDRDGDGKSDWHQAIGKEGHWRAEESKIKKEMKELAGKQREARKAEADKLADRLRKIRAGSRGVVVVVWKKSERVPFSGIFGGRDTGTALAFSAANTVDGDKTIGGSAIENMASKNSIFTALKPVSWLMDVVGLMYKGKNSIPPPFGPAIGWTLDFLGIDPPNVYERRVVLVRARDVLVDADLAAFAGQLKAYAGRAVDGMRKGFYDRGEPGPEAGDVLAF
ncbi:MAG: pilus assembly protein TadG-related protein [Candidatus Aquicultorales bacterium]